MYFGESKARFKEQELALLKTRFFEALDKARSISLEDIYAEPYGDDLHNLYVTFCVLEDNGQYTILELGIEEDHFAKSNSPADIFKQLKQKQPALEKFSKQKREKLLTKIAQHLESIGYSARAASASTTHPQP